MITVIGSLKGGSGKSTLTFNLAVWLAMAEASVRVLDVDPQATLCDVTEVRDEEGFSPSLKIESQSAMAEDLRADGAEVLLDVGTSDMEAMRRAIAMTDRVIVPVPPSQADIWSTQRFVRMVSEVTAEGQRPEVVVFINRGDTHHAVRETDEAAAALIALPGVRFIRARLGQRTAYRRSFSEGLAVFEMEPRGKAAREFIALAAALYPHVVS